MSYEGLDSKWVLGADQGLPEPDYVIYFDIDPIVASKRSEYGSERFENIEFQQKVHEAFLSILPTHTIYFKASKSKEIVYLEFQELIKSLILYKKFIHHPILTNL